MTMNQTTEAQGPRRAGMPDYPAHALSFVIYALFSPFAFLLFPCSHPHSESYIHAFRDFVDFFIFLAIFIGILYKCTILWLYVCTRRL